MANGSKNKAPTTEDLAGQLATLRADVAGLAGLLRDLGKAGVQDKAAALRSEGEHLAARAGEHADEALEMVRRQPAQSLALAVGLGFLAGLVMARR